MKIIKKTHSKLCIHRKKSNPNSITKKKQIQPPRFAFTKKTTTQRNETTRHDTTRHETTRDDTTRHQTTQGKFAHATTRDDTTLHETTRHYTRRLETTRQSAARAHWRRDPHRAHARWSGPRLLDVRSAAFVEVAEELYLRRTDSLRGQGDGGQRVSDSV